MPTVKVRNLKNEEVGDLELSDAVFGAELNESLIHAAVKAYLAGARQGTVGTKTRGDVSGSGRKLWKQKGTGRARIASIRSPLWKGGVNIYDVLYHEKLVLSRSAAEQLQAALDPKKTGATAAATEEAEAETEEGAQEEEAA